MFGADGYAEYFQTHIDGQVFTGTSEQLRVAAFAQAQRELEGALGYAIPSSDSASPNIRLDYACYELAMHLIKCAAVPGSGGAVPAYLGVASGDVKQAQAAPRAHIWPQAVWRWLGGSPSLVLSRG